VLVAIQCTGNYINTIVLLRMSTELLETWRGFK